jgi:phage FluMu gp28-like protein
MTTISPEEMKEYAKCNRKPQYFADKYAYGFNMVTKEYGNFELFDFQKLMISKVHNHQFNLIKKSRQMHVTSTLAMYVAWCTLFKHDHATGIVCPNKESAVRFLDNVRYILLHFNLGFDYKEDVIKDNKTELRLFNGSTVRAFAASPSALRGYTINLMIFDEAAYINRLDEMWMTCNSMCAVGGKVIFASTPKDVNFFHTIWEGAKKGTNFFEVQELVWHNNPLFTKDLEFRDDKPWSPWYEAQCKHLNNNDTAIDRELWGKFVSGIRPDVPKRINFRLEPEIYDKIIERIDEREISLTDYMKELIKKDLEIE